MTTERNKEIYSKLERFAENFHSSKCPHHRRKINIEAYRYIRTQAKAVEKTSRINRREELRVVYNGYKSLIKRYGYAPKQRKK